MPRKPKKESPHKLRPDVAETAYRTMLEATGQLPKTRPGEGPKNPEAMKRGAKGGKKGGIARKTRMTDDQRAKGGTIAALARWEKEKG